MNLSQSEVETYLEQVKDAVRQNRYRLSLNSNRSDNRRLFAHYLIKENDVPGIIMSLTYQDFSEAVPNEHPQFRHETLYVFGKELELIERFGSGKKLVPLYIKFNKLDDNYVIIVSFHEEHYPLKKSFH